MVKIAKYLVPVLCFLLLMACDTSNSKTDTANPTGLTMASDANTNQTAFDTMMQQCHAVARAKVITIEPYGNDGELKYTYKLLEDYWGTMCVEDDGLFYVYEMQETYAVGEETVLFLYGFESAYYDHVVYSSMNESLYPEEQMIEMQTMDISETESLLAVVENNDPASMYQLPIVESYADMVEQSVAIWHVRVSEINPLTENLQQVIVDILQQVKDTEILTEEDMLSYAVGVPADWDLTVGSKYLLLFGVGQYGGKHIISHDYGLAAEGTPGYTDILGITE